MTENTKEINISEERVHEFMVDLHEETDLLRILVSFSIILGLAAFFLWYFCYKTYNQRSDERNFEDGNTDYGTDSQTRLRDKPPKYEDLMETNQTANELSSETPPPSYYDVNSCKDDLIMKSEETATKKPVHQNEDIFMTGVTN